MAVKKVRAEQAAKQADDDTERRLAEQQAASYERLADRWGDLYDWLDSQIVAANFSCRSPSGKG